MAFFLEPPAGGMGCGTLADAGGALATAAGGAEDALGYLRACEAEPNCN